MSMAVTDSRIEVLEQVVILQKQLQDSRDEIFELKRDGQAEIDDLNAQLDSERRRASRWQERHDSLGQGLILSALLNVAIMSFVIWRAF